MWEDVILFTAVGFAAQLIDGALGMAYGLSATTVLLSLGTAPAMASASVHAAEVFTTAASGLSHWRLGNVDPKLVVRLAVPGMIGGAVGAYLLASLPGESMRPAVAVYLLGMGALIVWRAVRRPFHEKAPRHVVPLGLIGGFVDAVGGGGWGPLVASTLVGRGAVPRMAIGSVNLAEFFVTLTVSGTFLATVGLDLMPIILGLVLGGVVAAPFAALATRHIPDRPLMLLVGAVIVLLSLRELVRWVLA
jgi:uncharacterized membrane protein YfcA